MGDKDEGSSVFSSATVIAAIIAGVSAVMSAVLPWLLRTHETHAELPITPLAAQVTSAPLESSAPMERRLPETATTRTLPNLTFGVWTIVDAVDEVGTDFSGSTIKFATQREIVGGLELTGAFEWRGDNNEILGQEHFIANYDATSRQLFIEGQYVQSPDGRLAVGSFSAKLSDDGRQLVEGTWGNTPNNLAGIPGSWQARR